VISINKELIGKLEPSLYVSCVLSAIESEGDPRNLILVYDLLQFILLNYCQVGCTSEMEPFIEDIFDKISCYFPINFTPPKDDKFKITPIMLK
jgi:DNA repair/transcription protein MET18/MMS19